MKLDWAKAPGQEHVRKPLRWQRDGPAGLMAHLSQDTQCHIHQLRFVHTIHSHGPGKVKRRKQKSRGQMENTEAAMDRNVNAVPIETRSAEECLHKGHCNVCLCFREFLFFNDRKSKAGARFCSPTCFTPV